MRTGPRPAVVVLAGPNGAGKSTMGPELLKGTLGVTEFVNADVIARGLSAFDPERAAIPAGRVMLSRLRELARHRVSFAFETTLASRSFAPWLERLIRAGYKCRLVYLWLPSADFAVARVRDRVRMGGHEVPEEIVRRRYTAGLRNFFDLYRALAASWVVYDNSGPFPLRVASGRGSTATSVSLTQTWDRILKGGGHGPQDVG
ncbi:MAG: AAA family ATPase [Planctomycetes bacterium]|nr:AAA family ATPase [Planctomycetota bacterium]